MSIVTKFLGVTAMALVLALPARAADLTADSVMATVDGTAALRMGFLLVDGEPSGLVPVTK